MNKYLYAITWIAMVVALLVFVTTVNTHYQEEIKNNNFAISSCEESMQYDADAITIVNYIKSDSANEEVVRKCDRVLEYISRSKEATSRTKDALLRK
jgi:hypothetical protein